MALIGHGVEICTSLTRPTAPMAGTLIFESDTASHRWYNGSTWLGVIPEGTVQSYAGTAAPTGWLFCFGQTLNSITSPEYARLFAVIGTAYGGTGASSFIVPDLRGRVLAGKDDMGGTAASRLTSGGSGIAGTTLGAAGGSETHTLTTAQIPAHGHTFSVTGTVDGGAAVNFGSNYTVGARTSFSGTTANAGGGGAHQNAQPTIVLNYIIKF